VGFLIMSRIWLKLTVISLTVMPSLVLACPYCAGSDTDNYFAAIAGPISALLGAPFVIFGVIAFIVYRSNKGDSSARSRAAENGHRPKKDCSSAR
tara:strand:- start:4115 stop:4399 length:285 start_codon:yes stop_codon:yes gene_type:complete